MADLGTTYYVGIGQALVTPISKPVAVPTTDRGTYSRFPFSGRPQDDWGQSFLVFPDRFVPAVPVFVPSRTIFLMRGRDVDCARLTYRYWRTFDAPDYAAAQYIGPKCGPSALVEVVVIENAIS